MGTGPPTMLVEPASVDPESAVAGSMSSPPTATADALRAISCALLVAGSVASPTSAPLLVPFIPALVAIRLLRARTGARRFLLIATMLAAAAAAAAAAALVVLPVALVAALVFVPILGLLHRRAAQRDPVDSAQQQAWPEPRLDTGLSLAVIGWVLAILVLVVAAVPASPSPRSLGRELVQEGYGPYERGCAKDGAFAQQQEFCDRVVVQRDAVNELVDDAAPELLAALLALLAVGAAGTTHPIVLARARRHSARIRPAWRLRELEVHWIAAYLVAIGLVGWMLAGGDSTIEVAARCASIAIGTVGALLVTAQGIGLVAWLLTRGRTPGWYRVVLAIAALFVTPLVLLLTFALGAFDMALRPRRRAANSARIPGRGSEG